MDCNSADAARLEGKNTGKSKESNQENAVDTAFTDMIGIPLS